MRQGNERIASFSRQVDAAFLARAGLSYDYVKESLESSKTGPRLADAVGRNIKPTAFADLVCNHFGMKDSDHADAIPHNRRVAGLVQFAADNPEWTAGSDGAIYRDGPDGVERLSPGRDVSKKFFGFVASVSGEGTLSVKDGRVIELSGDFVPRTGDIDIGEAVEKLEATYDHGFKM